jgi:SAM-dependent methyltransferase
VSPDQNDEAVAVICSRFSRALEINKKPNPAVQPSVFDSARQWWRENLEKRGCVDALVRLMALWRDFLRDSMPEQRRRRYGDFDFDWDHHVDTTSATVRWQDRLVGFFHSPYQATEPRLFEQMLGSLDLEFCEYTFVDIGSGKGRALLMATDYPFRRIVGVELLPELHRIAEENIASYKSESQKCFNLQSLCEDARHFQFPEEPMLLYLFNPLPESGLAELLKNLEQSLLNHPRSVYLLYHNPVLGNLVRGRTWQVLRRTGQYSIFSNSGSEAGG